MGQTIRDCKARIGFLASEFAHELNLEPASLLKCHRWVQELERFVSVRLGFMAWCQLPEDAAVRVTDRLVRWHVVKLSRGVARELGVKGGRLDHSEDKPERIRSRLDEAVRIANDVLSDFERLTAV